MMLRPIHFHSSNMVCGKQTLSHAAWVHTSAKKPLENENALKFQKWSQYIFDKYDSQVAKTNRCFISKELIGVTLNDMRTGKNGMPIFLSGFLQHLFVKEFRNDPEILFYPGIQNAMGKDKNVEEVYWNKEPYPMAFIFFEEQKEVHCSKLLIEMLKETFAKKTLFVSALYLKENEGRHAITFAASDDGRAYFIDSAPDNGTSDMSLSALVEFAEMFSSGAVFTFLETNLKTIELELNGQSILNRKGEKINFQVKYIRTNVQKKNDCWLFSCLYPYKIAQKRDIEAYQEVNGAFLEGKWEEINDYKNKMLRVFPRQEIPLLWRGNTQMESFMEKIRCHVADHISTKLESVGNVSKKEARIAEREIQSILEEQRKSNLYTS
jgi:hypothetical protein